MTVTERIIAHLPLSLSLLFAVEVLDTTQWGLNYEAPVGMDFGKISPAFELTVLFYMAGNNNTKVTLPGGSSRVLQQGESGLVRVNQADKLVSDKPIQVVLAAGDVNSTYEVRWYSMRPIENYARSYVTPVGDSYGKTKVVIYNPGPAVLTFTLQYLLNGVRTQYSQSVNAKQAAFTIVIPTGSGALIDGTSNFVALSLTDTESKDSSGQTTNGQAYDWGFPLVPRNELTSQVLIGLGYACTNNNCQGKAWQLPQ